MASTIYGIAMLVAALGIPGAIIKTFLSVGLCPTTPQAL